MTHLDRTPGGPPGPLGAEPGTKNILVFVSRPDQLDDLITLFRHVPGCRVRDGDAPAPSVDYHDLRLRFHPARERHEVLERLRQGYFNFVLLDLRSLSGDDHDSRRMYERAAHLLDDLDGTGDIEAGYGFHRIVAMISTSDDERGDRWIADLARRGIGQVLRDRTRRPAPTSGEDTRGVAFAARLLYEMYRRMKSRRPGKKALCGSGGGITGIYFEMGVLKCLDDCLGPCGVSGFDAYYGISAGAVVNGLLANGYSVDEMMAGVLGLGLGRIAMLDLSLLRLAHIDMNGYVQRIGVTTRDLGNFLWQTLRKRGKLSLESLFLRYGDVVAAPLRGDAFEARLHALFESDGSTDDFRRLPRPLYIGATNQDTRLHVVFGSPGHEDIPISKAIHASFALNPAFVSTRIGDAFYEDGAVTRTSNFEEAIANGADLIFIVDPFVPYVSKKSGYFHRKGFLYNIDQDLRTLSYTRFERARADALRKHPEVSSYTFLPANRLRRLMSRNPMDHRPFLPIWRGAYLSTHRRLHALRHRLAGDLLIHGMTLDMARANAVAARLTASEHVRFEDFFPDGQIALRIPTPPQIEQHAPSALLAG